MTSDSAQTARRRVAVTGSTGKLGRTVVAHLAERGYDVLALDRTRPESPATPFVAVDLTDYGQVFEAFSGGVDEHSTPVDAVVHLAAIPAPGPDHQRGDLRQQLGRDLQRLRRRPRAAGSAASSGPRARRCSACRSTLPRRTSPSTRSTHPRPESTYSLNKALEEEMARHFCRWDPELTMVGLRFSNVMDPEDYAAFPSFDADPSPAQVEPLGLHRRPRRRAGRAARARADRARVSRCSSSPTPTP